MMQTSVHDLLNQESNGSKVILTLPMPTSVNESLSAIGGRFVKTSKARSFLRNALISARSKRYTESNRRMLTSWINERFVLRVDCYYVWPESRLFTSKSNKQAKSWVKQIDAHNRNKQMHDALSDIFQIDDKYFFAGDTEKIGHYQDSDETFSIIKITKTQPRTLQQIAIQL